MRRTTLLALVVAAALLAVPTVVALAQDGQSETQGSSCPYHDEMGQNHMGMMGQDRMGMMDQNHMGMGRNRMGMMDLNQMEMMGQMGQNRMGTMDCPMSEDSQTNDQ